LHKSVPKRIASAVSDWLSDDIKTPDFRPADLTRRFCICKRIANRPYGGISYMPIVRVENAYGLVCSSGFTLIITYLCRRVTPTGIRD